MNALCQNLECSCTIALIIRHAERHPIIKLADAFDACLTDKGKSDAYRYGQIFQQNNSVKLYHSPVLRCQQTAESISSGILSTRQNATVVGNISELGAPYITGAWEKIAPVIERHGFSSFVRKWFNNEFSSDFIMPLELAAKTQLSVLVKQLHSKDSSTINITHDLNIMILREHYFNLRHEDIGEPDYLDGLFAYMNDESLHLCYHDHGRIIDPSAI